MLWSKISNTSDCFLYIFSVILPAWTKQSICHPSWLVGSIGVTVGGRFHDCGLPIFFPTLRPYKCW